MTQKEIDKLLSNMKTGRAALSEAVDDEPGVARLYDFQSASKFTKEQIKTLGMIHEGFGNQLSSALMPLLRTFVDVKLVGVEEHSFVEYYNSLEATTILAIWEAAPLNGHMIWQVSAPIAYEMINRTLGGVNVPDGEKNINNPLTEIELVLIEKMMYNFIPPLKTAWSKIVKISPVINRIEVDPQFAQVVDYNDAVVIVTYKVQIGDEVSDLISICIPQYAIEPIAKLLNAKTMFSNSTGRAGLRPKDKQIKTMLYDTKLDLVAQLNSTVATLEELTDLHVGDVMRLDHKVSDPVSVKVGHFNKFIGKLGTMSKCYAVKITEIIHEEEFDDEG